MSSPRERQLTQAIKNMLMAIHNSEEIYKKFSKLKPKVIQMSQKEIDRAATKVALNVEQYVAAYEKRTKKTPGPKLVMKRIVQELENL